MRIAPTLLTAAMLVAASLAQATGAVQVSFAKPDEFVDIGHNRWDQDRTLDQLREVFKGWAAKLPDGQTLKVEVLDVDLAGRLQPRRGDEIRVLNGRADWPRIKLRWTLSAGDRTLKSGEDDLADMAYLQTFGGLDRSLSLPYEGRMLERWFAERVTGAR